MNIKDCFKHLALLSLTLLICANLPGCSSNDGPDYPIENESDFLGLINPDVLPGSWQLVSITDGETGQITQINRTFTIKNFDILQQGDNVVAATGMDVWLHEYEDVVYTSNPDDSTSLTLTYYKKSSAGLSTAKVHLMSFALNNDDSGSEIIAASAMSYSNNTLTSDIAAYNHSYYDQNDNFRIEQISGKMIMKKVE